MKTFKQYLKEAKSKVEIKKQSSDEDNASKRTITYDVYVNGKYDKTFKDVNDAIDYKEKLEKEL